MPFQREPDGYLKTAWSDCQGAWHNLREAVVDAHPFTESNRLLFHIDEGMSWESVRDLDRMRKALLLSRNIAAQGEAPEDVMFWIGEVSTNLDEAVAAIAEGDCR